MSMFKVRLKHTKTFHLHKTEFYWFMLKSRSMSMFIVRLKDTNTFHLHTTENFIGLCSKPGQCLLHSVSERDEYNPFICRR